MAEITKAVLQLGLPGYVFAVFYWLGWGRFWYWWCPLLVVALWLGLRFGWTPLWVPRLTKLRKQLQGYSPEDKPMSPSLGDTHRDRLQQWASLRASHHVRSARALAWLGRWYHAEPFHPTAFARALTIAVGYTMLFWLLPWLFGGGGALGEAQLLPLSLRWWQRWLILLGFVPLLLYGLAKARYTLMGRSDVLTFAVAVALAFAFALVFAGVNADAAGTGAFVGAVVFAGAVAFTGAGAGAGAGAVTGAITAAVAVSVAFKLGAVVAVTGAVTIIVAIVTNRNIDVLHERAETKIKTVPHASVARLHILLGLGLAAAYLPLLLPALALPLWLPPLADWLGFPLEANWAHPTRPGFALVFFLACLPWLNAVSDYLSVGATQWLLNKYQPGRGGLWLVVADIAIAFALTLLLYLAAIGLLYLMLAWGWGVNAGALKDAFVGGIGWNLNSPAFWLVLLALTNIVPTLCHLGWAVWAWAMHLLSPAPAHIEEWLVQLQSASAGQGLNTEDAEALARYVLVDHWVSAALVLSLLPPVVAGFMWLIPQAVDALF